MSQACVRAPRTRKWVLCQPARLEDAKSNVKKHRGSSATTMLFRRGCISYLNTMWTLDIRVEKTAVVPSYRLTNVAGWQFA